MSDVAAILFAALAAVAVAFQLALACGAPWGELTLGGKYRGRLPLRARLIPLVSAACILAFVLIVLARAGLVFANFRSMADGWMWLVISYCVLGALANAITPSRRERALWLPVLVLMLGSCIVVAMSSI
jgi:cytochrome bd-type quinol oxidase subunit 2